MQVGGHRGLLQMHAQTVDFVDYEDRTHAFLERLLQNRESLGAHALDGVHHHQTTVAETHCGGDVGAEIDVARGIHQVDQIGHLLLRFLSSTFVCNHLIIFEKERDRACLHSNASVLLFFPTNHMSMRNTNRLSMYRTSPASRVEIIPFELIRPSASLKMVYVISTLRCLPVIDVSQDANVSHQSGIVLQFLNYR